MKRAQFSIPNDVGEFTALKPAVSELLEKHAVPDTARYTVQLVLEELLLNVHNHAFDDTSEQTIQLDLSFDADRIVIVVEDEGIPFNPLLADNPEFDKPIEERPVGGLGIHLVRSMVDQWDYQRRGSTNRNEIHVCFSPPS